jgi:UDP-GlcNAc:undecaprenyl-phosphate GlcNAc-1-phosphate transferase
MLLVAGLILSWISIALLRRVAPALGLIDRPGGPNGRKTHAAPTPVVGGLGIAAGLAAGLALTGGAAGAPPALVAAMLAVVALGAVDDRFDLPKVLRFAVQIAAGLAVARAAGVHELPFLTAALGVAVPAPLTLAAAGVAVAALINAVNWLDGLDGLLGALALISLTLLLYFLAGTGDRFLVALLALAAGAVVAFLGFNLRRPGRPRAAVFMGDAGSGLIAVILGYTMLVVARSEGLDPLVMVGAGNGIFFADMAFVMGLRVLTHGRPWQCDRTHLHHRLTDRGLGVTETVLVAASAHALFLGLQASAIAPDPGLALPGALALASVTAAVIAGGRSAQIQRRLPALARPRREPREPAGR